MSQQQAQLVNCKKCGALFVKSGNRDICDNCYKEEVKETDKIKGYIQSTGKTNAVFAAWNLSATKNQASSVKIA